MPESEGEGGCTMGVLEILSGVEEVSLPGVDPEYLRRFPVFQEYWRRFYQGGTFPWWDFEERYSPAPYWVLVITDREMTLETKFCCLSRCCPNCDSAENTERKGPPFAPEFFCARCGFGGPHPLFGLEPQWEKVVRMMLERPRAPRFVTREEYGQKMSDLVARLRT